MIEIKEKTDCCGCSACVQICPCHCIQMKNDREGFMYPHTDLSKCKDCGLCNKVCPIINRKPAVQPVRVYAARNNNPGTREESSSGGIFTPLAETIIRRGGAVFGVSFDREWNAVHTCARNMEEISAFRGSKYMQSSVGKAFIDTRTFLQDGKDVLFSGTPCQIAGLKLFLRKEYPNLFTVEILCHGAPSPMVWQKYLDIKKRAHHCSGIRNINFRNKQEGWKQYRMVIEFCNGDIYTCSHKKDPYFKGFLKNLYLRPSCYACKCKHGRSGSDIVLGDYWNIDNVLPEYNDKKGTSLLLVNTEKGNALLESISADIDSIETGYKECIGKNGGFAEYVPVPADRKRFFRRLEKNSNTRSFPVGISLKERIRKIIK